jgi:hypothetical protein
VVDPGEDALDHPSPGQDLEADLIGEFIAGLDGDRRCVPDPVTIVGAVGEGEFDEGERPS